MESGGSHAVRMAALLSSDTGTPRSGDDEARVSLNVVPSASPSPSPPASQRSRTGLSSLMNSPMEDEDEDVEMEASADTASASASGDEESEARRSADREEGEEDATPRSASDDSPAKPQRREDADPQSVDRLELQDAELESLKRELQAAMWKFLGRSDAPVAKRQKKGKQGRRNAAARTQATGEGAEEVERCIHALNNKASAEFESPTTMSELIRFCLAFLEALNEKEPIDAVIVRTRDGEAEAVDFDATVEKLSEKPLYLMLAGVVRRTLGCATSESVEILLALVSDWCFSTSSTQWSWLFVVIATIDSYSTLEYLLTRAAKKRDRETTLALPLIEYLASKYPSHAVDILQKLLEECAVSSSVEVRGGPIATVLENLLALATDSSTLIRLCDDSLQWIVTEELVFGIAENLSAKTSATQSNGSSENLDCDKNFCDMLLKLLELHGGELVASGFHIVVLLRKLLLHSSPFTESVRTFYARVIELARSGQCSDFLQRVYRFLPFLCKTTLRALHSTCGDDDMNGSSLGNAEYSYWADWMSLLASSASRQEVLKNLVETDLALADFSSKSSSGTTPGTEEMRFVALLNSIIPPGSSDYQDFIRALVDDCRSEASHVRQERRLLVLRSLLELNRADTQGLLSTELPLVLSNRNSSGPLGQLLGCSAGEANCIAFNLWMGSRGIEYWEGFLDLARSRYRDVSDSALELLDQTPFQSFEDPVWQYRCLRKLTLIFFSTLRLYREELVQDAIVSGGTGHADPTTTRKRLQRLKVVLFRLLGLEGGVANYPSSVFSVFASLWVDALLSHHSATSIPTHFPNRVNFAREGSSPVMPDERVVIRSERTISSKCTNLQASKVITHVPETLVYRKTLDLSWEQEMDAARICSASANDVLAQILTTAGTVSPLALASRVLHGDDLCERRLKVVVDLLLERVIPCCGIPSDDTYKEMLPNRSSYDVDLRIEQWLNHFPAFLPLLEMVVSTSASIHSAQSLRLAPVIKSALVVQLGHWNSVKGELAFENLDVAPYMRNRNQLALSCSLLRLLRLTGWLPAALGRAAELLPLTTPADIRAILFSCWFYLSDHPPTGSRAPTPATSAPSSPVSSGSSPAGSGVSGSAGTGSSRADAPQLEFYLIPVRRALHRNIHRVGAKYPLFMC